MDASDHDILIKIQTVQELLLGDFREFRKNNHMEMAKLDSRVGLVENHKLSRADFDTYKKDRSAADDVILQRLDKIQRIIWMALGVISLLAFLGPKILAKVISVI